jgi:hypothetical protein
MDKNVYEFISTQTNDPIVERKTCNISGQPFAIFQSDVDFYEKISPTFDGKKFAIPTPSISFEERRRMRDTFKNDRTFFKSICTLTGKPIITTYNPAIYPKIYITEEWWSDKRNALDYGFPIDDSKSFFEQYKQLLDVVPKIALINDNNVWSENCEYNQDTSYAKDCYLVSMARKLRNSHYSCNIALGEDMIDCFFVMQSEIVYECLNCNAVFKCFFLRNSNQCTNCLRWYDMIWCTDCLFCVGLRNRQYMIWNKQVSKEEFEHERNRIYTLMQWDICSLHEQFENFLTHFPKKATNMINTQHSYWHNLVNADKAIFCSNIMTLRDVKYCRFGDTFEDTHDLTSWGQAKLSYQCIVPDEAHHICFSIFCCNSSNIWYSEMCHFCNNCFGCVWLVNKQYCIFNKQYEKEEYERLVSQLIQKMQKNHEWGERFPIHFSSFAYNESIAQFFDPISKQEALARWYQRRDYQDMTNIPKDIERFNLLLPLESLDDETILTGCIVCESSGKPFKITKPELAFYRKHHLPLPREHPDVRFQHRLEKMELSSFSLTTCTTCWQETLTVHQNCKVYCEDCYNKEIYW